LITIAVNQRVEIYPKLNERRDCLDQRWADFLFLAGFNQLSLPNDFKMSKRLINNIEIKGILLTGGGDLADYGGESPERDKVEIMLLEHAINRRIPLIGVCRGMQVIQHYFGVSLQPVSGHVATKQTIEINGNMEKVNSYHNLGTETSIKSLEVWARSSDGVVKALRHRVSPLIGIMWHPERLLPFRDEDIKLFQNFYER